LFGVGATLGLSQLWAVKAIIQEGGSACVRSVVLGDAAIAVRKKTLKVLAQRSS
jgi:hypothetical protein